MERRRVRIGDVIDDYCTRCRLIMNHGVVGMVGDDVRKVRCNTCMSEHVYKHGKVPARKRRETDRLFAEVLRGMGREPGEPAGPDDDRGAPVPVAEADDRDAPGPAAHAAEDAAPAEEPSASGDPAATGEGGGVEAPGEAERPADSEHGVRRKLYTIRRFSGGKAPTGGGSTGGGSTGR